MPSYEVKPIHRYIADHLEKVERGEIRKLVIEVQPRIGKSELSTIRFSGWWLGRNPNHRIMLGSAGGDLATEFGRKIRNLVESGVYQGIFPGVYPARDSRAVDNWNLAAPYTGGMLSRGVGGSIVGRGGDVIFIDDPVRSRADADSPTIRKKVWDWYNDDLLTRRMNEDVPIIIVTTRWHRDDLVGRLLASEPDEWTVIRVPALAEPDDPLGRAVGDVLWPEKFSRAFLENLRDKDGDFEALYQQNPQARGGATFDRTWWTETEEHGDRRYFPHEIRWRNLAVGRWLFWDTALKDDEENDYTSCTVLELQPDYRVNVREVRRHRLQFPDLPSAIVDMATRYNRDGKLQGVIIEDKGSGTSAIQTLRGSAPDWLRELVAAYEPYGSKEYRASLVSVWCKLGCVLLPHPGDDVPWLAEFEDELFNFPSVSFDDQVDSFVMGLKYLEHQLEAGYQLRVAKQRAGDEYAEAY